MRDTVALIEDASTQLYGSIELRRKQRVIELAMAEDVISLHRQKPLELKVE